MEVVAVDGERSFAEWCALTDRLYASTPQFIPPLKGQLHDFYRREAPYFAHGDIEFLSIVSDGKVVARTTAHTNTKLDAKLGAPHLLFGFTEFVDDDGAFGALSDAQWRQISESASRQDAAGRWVFRYDPDIAVTFKAQPFADVDMRALSDEDQIAVGRFCLHFISLGERTGRPADERVAGAV